MTTTTPTTALADLDLDKLDALADAATPGEWTVKRQGVVVAGPYRQYANGSAQSQIAAFGVTYHHDAPDDEPERQQANATFCAAFNPETAKKLIALARRAAQPVAPVQLSPVVHEALDIAHDLAVAEADRVHEAYKGYKPHRHAAVDADVETIKQAIAEVGAVAAPSPQVAEGAELPTARRVMDIVDEFGSGAMAYTIDDLRDAIAASRRAESSTTIAHRAGVIPEGVSNAEYWRQQAAEASARVLVLKRELAAQPAEGAGQAKCTGCDPAEGFCRDCREAESAGQAGQVAKGPDQQQIEWGNDLQGRLIDLSQDMTESEDARQVMAEAACLLASLTGHAVSQ